MINCNGLDKINDRSIKFSKPIAHCAPVCAASESLIKLMNSCDLIKGGELLVSPLLHVWYAFQTHASHFLTVEMYMNTLCLCVYTLEDVLFFQH